MRFYRKYNPTILRIYAIVFFMAAISFFVLGFTPNKYDMVKDAVDDLKSDLELPKTLQVYQASMTDEVVVLEFVSKDTFGQMSELTLYIFYYDGDQQGRIDYYDEEDNSYPYFYNIIETGKKIPLYIPNEALSPLHLQSVFLMGIAVLLLAISFFKKTKEVSKIGENVSDVEDDEYVE